MNKVILSSLALKEIISKATKNLLFNQCEILVKCNNRKLSFGSYKETLDVETKKDWEVIIRVGDLRRLIAILHELEDQPLVISFKNENHNWIEMSNIVI